MDCRARCWIAGIIAGLLVFIAVAIIGSGGPVAGLMLGLLTTWMLSGILAWGLCAGAGSAADNAAFLAADWTPEPFEPSRRIVAPGGAVLSTATLSDAAPLPGGAARPSVTLTPAQGSTVAPTITGGPPTNPQAPTDPQAPAGTTPAAVPDASPAHPETTPPPPVRTDRPLPRADAPPQPGEEPPYPAETMTHPDDTPPPNAATPFAAHEAEEAATAADVPHAEDVPPPARPLVEGEALVMESLGGASPHADAEAGAGPDDMVGGIIPLKQGGDSQPAADGTGGGSAPEGARDRAE